MCHRAAGIGLNVQDQLNRAKAALHGGRYADAKAGFERLAEQGNPDAQFYLGRMAAGGMGVSQDLTRAISCPTLAVSAAAGSVETAPFTHILSSGDSSHESMTAVQAALQIAQHAGGGLESGSRAYPRPTGASDTHAARED